LKQSIKSALAIYFVGLSILISQPGCKEHTVISSGFAPGINNVDILVDSFSILTKTKYYDSVITSNALQYIYMGAGIVQDPVIGKTNAGIYLQLIPGQIGLDYTKVIVDSAFLILPYAGFTYGTNTDQNATESFSVYPITEAFSTANSYYGFDQLSIGNLYATGNVNIYHLQDSVNVGGVYVNPHLRMKLTGGSTNPLVSDLVAASAVSSDYPTFTSKFPGIYIRATDTTSRNRSVGRPYFQLDGSTNYDEANVLLYVHSTTDTTTAQYTFYFSTQYCAHFNQVTHVYTPAAMAYFQSTAISDPEVLLENGPGAVVDVKIGGMRSLLKPDPTTNITKAPIITQAKLVYTVSQPTTAFQPPASTYPYSVTVVNGADVLSEVADRYPVASTSPLLFIDGAAKSLSSSDTMQYTLNVPREMQLQLTKALADPNNASLDTLHIRLNGSSDFWGAYRAILGGGNNSNARVKMKFNVVYSKLK